MDKKSKTIQSSKLKGKVAGKQVILYYYLLLFLELKGSQPKKTDLHYSNSKHSINKHK